MAEEETRARLTEMEAQIGQMNTMMAEMRAVIMDSQEARQTPPVDPNPSSSGKETQENTGRDKAPANEVPPPFVNLTEDVSEQDEQRREQKTDKYNEEAKRLARIEAYLASQGFEFTRSDIIAPYLKVQVPENYQDPEFPNKYDGTGCPKSHLRYFLRKMARYSDNALLMIHTFQDSLQGNALAWYIALDVENYEKWEELASEFLRQYKFNIQALPTREDLLRIEKRRGEALRQFTQRWKAVASQIKPAIQEDELMELFLKSLPSDYYDKLHVSGSHSFEHLVRLAERVEWRMKETKATEEHSRKPFSTRKDKGSLNEVAYVPNTNAYSAPSSRPFAQAYGTSRPNESKRRFPPRQFTPLPRPLSQLLPRLLEGRMVAKEVPRPNPPRFAGFDETKTCDYHMGERGHDVDNCLILKIKVQNLIDRGMLDFKEPEPNVHQNPLPEHQGVNMIDGDDSEDEFEVWKDCRRKADRRFVEEALANGETIAPLGDNDGAYRFMVKLTPPAWAHDPNLVVTPDGWGGMDDPEEASIVMASNDPVPGSELEVEFEDKTNIVSEESLKGGVKGESDEGSSNVKEVREIADDLFEEACQEENTLKDSAGEDCVAMVAPFVIELCNDDKRKKSDSVPKPVTIILTEEKVEEKEVQPLVIELSPREKFDTRAVPWDYSTNGVSAITRSGRCLPLKQNETKKKDVTEEDAEQVLSLIRTSEFEVIEQLRKMPAQVSLLELFKSSEKHKNALMKVLNEVHVPETINEEQLEDFVGAILLKDQILFSDEDFPEEGRSHNKALYIAVKCYGKEVSRVLVDNGSAFNLCPISTLRRLEKEKMLKNSKVTIRAFDGMKKEVLGEVELEVTIGPTVFLIDFQVVDVKSSFNLLLGRPWIHIAGAVPSSLHQRLKFAVGGKLVTVLGEVDLVAHLDGNVPYINPETTEEVDHHLLELVHMVHTPAGAKMRSPELSKSAIMSGKVLIENGYEPGKGLGKNAQGIIKPIIPPPSFARRGIGFHGGFSSSSSSGIAGGRGRGRYGNRGGRAINPNIWKGKVRELEFWEIPLKYTFPGPPTWLQDEDIHVAGEEDLSALFEDGSVNVIITELEDTLALE